MSAIGERMLGAAARAAVGVFFRRVEVAGRENLPAAGPLVVVANHVNALIDPILLLGLGPLLRPRFLGKSTLWRIWPLRPFLAWAGVIPVHRRQDAGVDPARNRETFAHCHELLRAGGAVALFPEGISHDEPALQPLKTGAARIVLEAPPEVGARVRLLPVGIVFEEKASFRSRVLLNVGVPLDPAPEVALAAREPGAAVRALTARLAAALEEVTLGYTSFREGQLLARGAALRADGETALPRRAALAEDFHRQRAALARYRRLLAEAPVETAAAARAVQSYDRLLRAFGLRDEQVRARYPLLSVGRYLARALLLLCLRLPLAVAGTALNWLPYQLVRLVAWWGRSSWNLQATLKLWSALLLYPAGWAAAAWAAARWTGFGTAALLVALAAPTTGWVALRFHEERATLVQEARAFLLLRTRRRLAEELRARRAAAATLVARLDRSGDSSLFYDSKL